MSNNLITLLLGAALLCWISLVTFLSLYYVPDDDLPGLINIPYFDKIVHFTFYFVMVGLGYFFLSNIMSGQRNRVMLLSLVLFAIAYGVLMEWLQGAMGMGRFADVVDALANSLGAIMGGWLVPKYRTLIGFAK